MTNYKAVCKTVRRRRWITCLLENRFYTKEGQGVQGDSYKMNFWNKLTSSSIRVLLPSNHLWSPGPVDVNDDCNCRASPSFSPAAFMASDIPVACPQHQPARPSERHSLENVLLFPPMSSSDPSHFPARQDISFHCHTFKTLFMRSKPPSKLQSVRLATWQSPLHV